MPEESRDTLNKEKKERIETLKIIILSSLTTNLLGRRDIDLKIVLIRKLLEKPRKIQELSLELGIKYTDVYNTLYSLFRAGILRKNDDDAYEITENYKKYFEILIKLYDYLKEKVREEKIENSKIIEFFNILQNPARILILYTLYKKGPMEIDNAEAETLRYLEFFVRMSYIPHSIIRRIRVSATSIRRYIYLMIPTFIKKEGVIVSLNELGRLCMERIIELISDAPIPIHFFDLSYPARLPIKTEDLKYSRRNFSFLQYTKRSLEDIVKKQEEMSNLIDSLNRKFQYIKILFESLEPIYQKIYETGEIPPKEDFLNKISELRESIESIISAYDRSLSKLLYDNNFLLRQLDACIWNIERKFTELYMFKKLIDKIKSCPKENVLDVLNSLISTYNDTRRLLSEEAKKKLIKEIITSALSRTDVDFKDILASLMDGLVIDSKIVAEILAEKLKDRKLG